MQRLSISKGHAFILVYSVVSRPSLDELRSIYQEIVSIRGADLSNIPVMLVGNKCDETASLREVTPAEGSQLAKSWKCGFMETSAKTDHNVKELFQELLQLERRRTMSLQPDSKTSRSRFNRDLLKAKCRVMWSRDGERRRYIEGYTEKAFSVFKNSGPRASKNDRFSEPDFVQ